MSGLKGSLWRKRKAKSVQNTIFLLSFCWQCWLIFHQNLGSIVIDQYEIQELFAAIDKEDDGIVYLQDVVVHLRALNEDIDKNLKVKVFLDELDTNGTMEVDFKRFCVNQKSSSNHLKMLSWHGFILELLGADGRPWGGRMEEGTTQEVKRHHSGKHQ